MKKYWEFFKISWQEFLVYRANFALWRARNVLQLLLVYFVWWNIFQSQREAFGYTISSILTYILITASIRAFVLGTRVTDLIDAINNGSVVNFLIKPFGLIRSLLARDMADKLFNFTFFIVEISLLIFFLKPPIFIQTNILVLMQFLLAIIGALIIYFCINLIISLTAFWTENSWGPLFLMSIFLESLGGGLFPIDILPKQLFNILMLTPFPYLIYFPAKLYLGSMGTAEMTFGFLITAVWIMVLVGLTKVILNAGFKRYSTEGN